MADDQLAVCRQRFADFARSVERSAPLYAALSAGVAADERLPGLLLSAPVAQRQPVLLFACVHWLLLNDPHDPLAAWYPNLTATPHRSGAIEGFRRFVGVHESELRSLLGSRSTQTNEIGRSSLFLPAFAILDAECGPLARVDVGASAGLNLLADSFHYDYEPGGAVGPADASVRLHCRTEGAVPVPPALPRFAAAVGLDPNPVDVRDSDQARWLEACVWPDDVERFHRLEAAIALARTVGVDLRRGDAVADTAALIAEVARRGHPVVTTSWVMNYLTPDERREFVAALDRTAADQDLSWVYAENPALCPELPGGEVQGDDPNVPTSLVLVRWRAGRRAAVLLARCHPHGRWMRWV
jgi:hypothetical protein